MAEELDEEADHIEAEEADSDEGSPKANPRPDH
jgi:hypothetical protein